MRVRSEENYKGYILQLGDVIDVEGDFYMVYQEYLNSDMENWFILKDLITGLGYTGYFEDLETLTHSLDGDEIIYKNTEYDLVLTKRE